jgi:hypothetical protein
MWRNDHGVAWLARRNNARIILVAKAHSMKKSAQSARRRNGGGINGVMAYQWQSM